MFILKTNETDGIQQDFCLPLCLLGLRIRNVTFFFYELSVEFTVYVRALPWQLLKTYVYIFKTVVDIL